MKKIFLLVHGLMNHDDHDMNNLFAYLNSKKEKEEEVKLVYLYNHEDHHSYKYKRQWKVLNGIVTDYLAQGYEVNVLGFSFSTSLVARLCKQHKNINRLVLISPTFKLIGSGFIPNYVKVITKSLKMKWKYRKNKKAKSKMLKAHLNHIISLIFGVLHSMIKNKKSYKYIYCPTLIMKGTEDEFVSQKQIYMIQKMMKSKEIDIKIYKDFNHTFIRRDDDCNPDVYEYIYRFIFK